MSKLIDINDNDYALMREACKEAAKCKKSGSAFSVGCVLATLDRQILTVGYSREFGEHWHAEEVAIAKAERDSLSLDHCILYSTLEPCGDRRSRPVSCAQLILKKNIRVVMFAESEPTAFVDTPRGGAIMMSKGVQVVQLDGFKNEFENQNKHIA